MITVVACFFLETAWIRRGPGMRVARIRPGAPAGFERDLGRPDLLVSTGFCGGLSEDLKTGDLILATEIAHQGRRIAVSPEILARAEEGLARVGIAPKLGSIVTAARVAVTLAEKGRLREETGAIGVEMEAGRLAEWADENGIGFIAVKAVLDEADEPLPLRRATDAILHPIAAVRAGLAGVRAGRAIGRGISGIVWQSLGG